MILPQTQGARSSPAWARSALAIRDATARRVVRRDLDGDLVAEHDADPMTSHLARQLRDHLVPLAHVHLERASAENFSNRAFELDRVVTAHGNKLRNVPPWGS